MVTINLESGGSLQQSVVASDRGFVHEPEASYAGDHRMLVGRSYMAWGAVIAGALSSLALLVLAASLGAASGIPAYRGGEFGAGAAIWAIVSFIAAFFVGGCIVSYLSPHREMNSGIVHGMMSWVLGILLMGMVAAGAFGLARGMFGDFYFGRMGVDYTPTHAQIVGAYWTTFLSLFLGLLAAVAGGVIGFTGKLAKVEGRVEQAVR